MKCSCGKQMVKVYVHHNQFDKRGQWEVIGYKCKSCNTIKLKNIEG